MANEDQLNEQQLLYKILEELGGTSGPQDVLLKATDQGSGDSEKLESVSKALKVYIDDEGKILRVEQQSPIGVENSSGTQIDPATQSTLQSVLNQLQGTIATEQQTPVQIEDKNGTNINPATEPTVTSIDNRLASETIDVEQQTPIQLENSSGANIDPATQGTLQSVLTELQNTLQVEQQTPVQLENSSGTNIDPAKDQSLQTLIGALVTQNTTDYMRSAMFGQHSASLPSLSDGDYGIPQLDDNSRLLVNLDTEIAGEDLGSDRLMVSLKMKDDGGAFGFVERYAPTEAVKVAESNARSFVGEQSFSPASGSSQGVNPSSNGVSGPNCDITIQNTGNEILWVTVDGTTDGGFKLKPDKDTGGEFYGHTSADGDIKIRTDSNAGGAGSAQAIYKE